MIRSHWELEVFKKSVEAAMRVFEATKAFPREEVYSLTDQVRRSSRSVCANLTEAWRKRRYEAAFVAKLNDAKAEAAETQTWLELAARCGYRDKAEARALFEVHEEILRMIVSMIHNRTPWLLPKS